MVYLRVYTPFKLEHKSKLTWAKPLSGTTQHQVNRGTTRKHKWTSVNKTVAVFCYCLLRYSERDPQTQGYLRCIMTREPLMWTFTLIWKLRLYIGKVTRDKKIVTYFLHDNFNLVCKHLRLKVFTHFSYKIYYSTIITSRINISTIQLLHFKSTTETTWESTFWMSLVSRFTFRFRNIFKLLSTTSGMFYDWEGFQICSREIESS